MVGSPTSSLLEFNMKLIDPPEGWRYGFPKEDDWNSSKETREEWFIRNGYPQELIVQGMLSWCRSIETN